MAEPVLVRPYRPADWAAIEAVHDAARLDELRLSVGTSAFRSLAATAEPEGLFNGQIWVAELGGRVVGFAATDEDEVGWLYVHPDAYRRGVGRALLRHAIDQVGGRARTSVLDGNIPALALYLSEGFVIVETKDGHLQGLEAVPARGHLLERAV
ncbi:MAG TPA: GNAT family N-acetyltransferase [Azospirillaceae bacterium]|nr:GNAT family N-acetyltransferase [Azospirillaceae bacterium]